MRKIIFKKGILFSFLSMSGLLLFFQNCGGQFESIKLQLSSPSQSQAAVGFAEAKAVLDKNCVLCHTLGGAAAPVVHELIVIDTMLATVGCKTTNKILGLRNMI